MSENEEWDKRLATPSPQRDALRRIIDAGRRSQRPVAYVPGMMPLTEFEEELLRELSDAAKHTVPCADCGTSCDTSDPDVIRYRFGPRWLCSRCFQLAFYHDFGRWPGEE